MFVAESSHVCAAVVSLYLFASAITVPLRHGGVGGVAVMHVVLVPCGDSLTASVWRANMSLLVLSVCVSTSGAGATRVFVAHVCVVLALYIHVLAVLLTYVGAVPKSHSGMMRSVVS